MSRSQPILRLPKEARVVHRRVRLALISVLLAAVSPTVPQPTLSTDRRVAMSPAPVTGVDQAVQPQVLPVHTAKAPNRSPDPAASVTRVENTQGEDAFPRKQISRSKVASQGMPEAALRAYRAAEATMRIADPSCRLSWALLAGIGRVESDHGRHGKAVLGANGVSSPHIVGVPLNGIGAVAAIPDTDDGTFDGDSRWDRAVGPMQFIPATWRIVGVDGDADGTRNPHDIDDAALAAGVYLCAGGEDLGSRSGSHDALFRYNHSPRYVALVSRLADAYRSGLTELPVLGASIASEPGVQVRLNNSAEGSFAKVGDKGNRAGKRGERADIGDAADDRSRRRRDGMGATEGTGSEIRAVDIGTHRPDKVRAVDEPSAPSRGGEVEQYDDDGVPTGRPDEPGPSPDGTAVTPTGSESSTPTGPASSTPTDPESSTPTDSASSTPTGPESSTPTDPESSTPSSGSTDDETEPQEHAADHGEPHHGDPAGSAADTQPEQDSVVDVGILHWCEPETQDTLCLDGDLIPAAADRYGHLVENGPTEVVLRLQSDGDDGGVTAIIDPQLAGGLPQTERGEAPAESTPAVELHLGDGHGAAGP